MRQKKKSVSVRLSESDIRKVKDIAERLGVKEADLFRYIIKNSLGKLLPLRNSEVKGIDLIPVLMECGSDLAHYLDLDTEQLDKIVNNGLTNSSDKKVAKNDLDLLTLAGVDSNYASFKLSVLKNSSIHESALDKSLKEYFYEKYSLDDEAQKAPSKITNESNNNLIIRGEQYAS